MGVDNDKDKVRVDDDTGKCEPTLAQNILAIHIAEYTALTARSTSLIAIAWSIYPMLIAFIGAVLYWWTPTREPWLLWIACSGVQLCALALIANTWEQYSNIHYIELRLRPLVAVTLKGEEFWCYEQYLFERREGLKATGNPWWEFVSWPALLVLIAVVTRRAFSLSASNLSPRLWDISFFVICSCILFFTFKKNRGVIALRKESFRYGPATVRNDGE